MAEQKESSVCEECQKKTEHKFMVRMSASTLDAKERIENIYANAYVTLLAMLILIV